MRVIENSRFAVGLAWELQFFKPCRIVPPKKNETGEGRRGVTLLFRLVGRSVSPFFVLCWQEENTTQPPLTSMFIYFLFLFLFFVSVLALQD